MGALRFEWLLVLATILGAYCENEFLLESSSNRALLAAKAPPCPIGSRCGTNGNDDISGTDKNDKIYGWKGNDVIRARGGDDEIDGGEGGDQMFPGRANGPLKQDTIYVDSRSDRVFLPGKTTDYSVERIPSGSAPATEYRYTNKKTNERYRIVFKNGFTANLLDSKLGMVAATEGDPHFTGFDGTRFDFHGYDGGVFNILSESLHQVNSAFFSFKDKEFPGTWMSGFGLRYDKDFTFTVSLNLQDYVPALEVDDFGVVRMVPPSKDFITVTVNDEPVEGKYRSGENLETGHEDVQLIFPDTSNAEEKYDGPIAILTTPHLEVTFYLETEGVLHLDMAVKVISLNLGQMHGVLGQTAQWDGSQEDRSIEGVEDDYTVRGGVLGLPVKHNLFASLSNVVLRRSLLSTAKHLQSLD